MKIQHLFTHDPRPGGIFRIPDAPDNVMLDVTWRCDQRCTFCYNPATDRRRGHPPLETLLAIQRVIADWGVREVLYLGGEPLLHPGFDRLVDAGLRRGLSQRVVTNGARLDTARAARFTAAGLEVGVSIHAANAAVHDALVRHRGSFARALGALDALVAAGASVWVQYSPTRRNTGALIQLAALLRSRYGDATRFLDINRLLPLGEAAVPAHADLLDPDGWWQALLEVAVLVQEGWAVRVESVPRCWIRARAAADDLPDDLVAGLLGTLRACMMGVNQLALDPEGRIKLCPAGPPVGASVLDEDPETLWRKDAALLERRALGFLPTACVDHKCGTFCREFYECAGGCRMGNRDHFDSLFSLSSEGIFSIFSNGRGTILR